MLKVLLITGIVFVVAIVFLANVCGNVVNHLRR